MGKVPNNPPSRDSIDMGIFKLQLDTEDNDRQWDSLVTLE